MSEIVLAALDRKPLSSAMALFVLLGSAAIVWFLTDLYYYVYSFKYPQDSNWLGRVISKEPFSFLQGMAYVNHRPGHQGHGL